VFLVGQAFKKTFGCPSEAASLRFIFRSRYEDIASEPCPLRRKNSLKPLSWGIIPQYDIESSYLSQLFSIQMKLWERIENLAFYGCCGGFYATLYEAKRLETVRSRHTRFCVGKFFKSRRNSQKRRAEGKFSSERTKFYLDRTHS